MRRTIVTNTSGAVQTILSDAQHGDVTWRLFRPETWNLYAPASSAASVLVSSHLSEVQLWRDDVCLSWGPAHTVEWDGDVLDVQGAGAAWWLDHRYIGPDDRGNLLSGADWDVGDLAEWTVTSGAGFTVTLSTQTDGTQVAWLTNTAASDSGPTLQQTLTVYQSNDNPAAGAFPRDLTLSAPVYFSGAYPDQTTAALYRLPNGWATLGDAQDSETWTVDDDVVSGWNQLELTMTLPATWFGDVVIQLRGPGEMVSWGPTLLDLDDGLEFRQEDLAEIARKVIDQTSGSPVVTGFVDNKPYYDAGRDVNLGVAATNTGTLADRRWMYSQRSIALRALDDLAEGDARVEWLVTYTSTDRIFTVSSTVGAEQAGMTVTPSTGTVRWRWNGEQAASAVVLLGPGSNLTRIEGVATSSSAFANSVGITTTAQAGLDVPVRKSKLDDIAARRLAVTVNPATLDVETDATWFDAGLRVGDRIRARLPMGGHTVTGCYRITAMTLTGDDRLRLACEHWPETF